MFTPTRRKAAALAVACLALSPAFAQGPPPSAVMKRTELTPPAEGFSEELFDKQPFSRITLQQAIELALRNNLEVQFEHVGIGVSKAQVRLALSAFDPVFSLTGQNQRIRRNEDITNPSTTSAINQQQQLQVQLNQATQQLNIELLNSQSSLNNTRAAQLQLISEAQVINQQRIAQGLEPLNLPTINGVDPVLLQEGAIVNPTLDNIILLDQRGSNLQTGIQGRTSYGTRYALQATLTQSKNDFEGNISPVRSIYESFVGISIQQPLLKNFGKDANMVEVRQSQIGAKVQTLTWKQNIASAIQGVMAAYYDMLYALNDMNVRKAAMDADNTLVNLYQRRVELGFSSPFDIRQAEVAVSTDRESFLAAKNIFLERQFALKRLISQKTNTQDARLYIPSDAPNLPPPTLNRAELLSIAYQSRFDYQITLLGADLQNVRLKFAKNQLLPQLDLVGTYGLNGLGGSYGESFDGTISADAPQYTIGFQFQVPLGNRQPRAQYEAILGQKEQAILRIRQSEVTVEADVDTIVARIETNRQRSAAARQTRELNEEAVRIAYRRLEEGQVSAYDITEQQRKLYDAKSRELAAVAEMNKSITQLWLVTGTVLDREGIRFHEPTENLRKPDKVMSTRALPETSTASATRPATTATAPGASAEARSTAVQGKPATRPTTVR